MWSTGASGLPKVNPRQLCPQGAPCPMGETDDKQTTSMKESHGEVRPRPNDANVEDKDRDGRLPTMAPGPGPERESESGMGGRSRQWGQHKDTAEAPETTP